MNIEDRELVLKDLCARLRSGVKILIENNDPSLPFNTTPYVNIMDEEHWSYFRFDRIDIIPYLRPMSSMTEDEHTEYYSHIVLLNSIEKYDWLNVHHFDYRGLIDRGLALEAPEGMYD